MKMARRRKTWKIWETEVHQSRFRVSWSDSRVADAEDPFAFLRAMAGVASLGTWLKIRIHAHQCDPW